MTAIRPTPSLGRLGRITTLFTRRPWLAYLALTVLAYPITEMVAAGERATQYAHDVFDDDVPRLFSIPADWRAFGPSLWDPHLTSGNALLAQFALPPTAPDVLLSFVVPPFAAYAINAALMTFAAGIAMHLFLRDSLRLPTIACFAGGILATFAFWQYILGYAILLLPLVLWTTDRALSDGPPQGRWWLGAIALVAFLLLSSLLQLVVLDGAVALAYVLATSAGTRQWPRAVAKRAAIWVAAALLAAPVLATQILALPESQRSVWDLDPVSLTQGIRDVAHRYALIVFGVRSIGHVGGSADIYGSYFPGALALPFLALSLVVPRVTGRLRFALLLLLAIPFFDLAASLAAHAQEHLPLIGSFQFVRVRHFVPVAVAINVAIGISWAVSPLGVKSMSVPRRTLGGVLFGAAVGAVLFQGAAAVQQVVHPPSAALLRAGWQLALVALIGGLVLFGAILLLFRRVRTRGWIAGTVPTALAALLLIGLAGERLLFSRAERDLDGNLGSWAANVTPTTAQAFIAGQAAPGRVLSLGEDANRVLSSGLDAVDGYETIYPLRYHELFGALTAPHLDADPVKYRYYHSWGNRAYAFGPEIDWPIADLLGVRWIYVKGQTALDPSLQRRFADGKLAVYENPGAFPRAFIVHAVSVTPDRPALIAALQAASAPDLRTRAYLASADAGDLAAGLAQTAAPQDPSDKASISVDTPDRVSIQAHAEQPGVLVLADTYDDGWTAEVDGVASRIFPVDDALRGVRVPAGDHIVTFVYQPLATLIGLAVALLTGAIVAVAGIRGRRGGGFSG